MAILRWAFAVCLLMLAFGLLVRLAPAAPRDSRWASIGAAIVLLVGIELDEQLRKDGDGAPSRLRRLARGLF